jgi:hypothetical protein
MAELGWVAKKHRSLHETWDVGPEARRPLGEQVALTIVTSAILNDAQISRKLESRGRMIRPDSMPESMPESQNPTYDPYALFLYALFLFSPSSSSRPLPCWGWAWPETSPAPGPSASDLDHGSEREGAVLQACATQACGVIFRHQLVANLATRMVGPVRRPRCQPGGQVTDILGWQKPR